MVRKILKEPLVHFLLIGAAIFLCYAWLNRDAQHPEGYTIVITSDQQVKMALQYQKNFGALPDSTALRGLIAAEIKNEIFYREALRLGLDDDDEIIRRRLKQKYEFIQSDNIITSDPSNQELKEYYESHKSNYMEPSAYSFEHYYFSPDHHEDPQQAAEDFLKGIGDADAFHIPSPLRAQDERNLRDAFGFQFAQELSSITDTSSRLVLSSGFGFHVVKILSIDEAEGISFAKAKGQVYQDYLSDIRKVGNKEMYDDLLEEYQIEIEAL